MPIDMLAAIRANTSHKDFLDGLLTEQVQELAKKIYDLLKAKDTILNPGRKTTVSFNMPPPPPKENIGIPESIKELIAVQAALDVIYSAKYNKAIRLQSGDPITRRIDEIQEQQGAIEHIKAEGTVIYHGVYHPLESSAVTADFVQEMMGGTVAQAELDVLKRRAATLFVHHDRVQNLDAANKPTAYAKAKMEGFNEVETAGDFFEERSRLYTEAIVKLEQTPGNEEQIAKLKEMQEVLAYEAWKFIVGGTTMLKKVDGQLTLNTLQVLAIDVALDPTAQPDQDPALVVAPVITAEQMTAMKANYIVAASLAASAVDSHFPAMLGLIKAHPDMGANLPSTFISPVVRDIMFAEPDDADKVNQTALFLGQNMRMFSEIHEAFFNFGSALTQIQSFDPKFIEGKDGVALWNAAMHAARMGDQVALKKLLDTQIEHFKGAAPPGISVGMTLVDVFMAKIGGEIDFANGQGPELIVDAAKQRKLAVPPIDVEAWKNHAKALVHLKAAYDTPDASPALKSQIAMTLFQIAGNQLGLYLKNEVLLENIASERLVLADQHRDLLDAREALGADLIHLKGQIEILEKSIIAKLEPAAQTSDVAKDSSALMMAMMTRMSTDVTGDLLAAYRASVSKMTREVDVIDAQLQSLESQLTNLQRVEGDLLHIVQVKKDQLSVHPEPEPNPGADLQLT